MRSEDSIDTRESGSWPGVSLVQAQIAAMKHALHDLEDEIEEAIRRCKSEPPPEAEKGDEAPKT